MPSYEEIKEQINSLEHKYVFYTKKEIRFLPNILVDGEQIRALTSGFNEGRTVLAVCTNRRILFLDKGMFFGLRQWQMALDRIQAIDGDYALVFGRVRFWDGAAPLEMNMVLASTIDPFIKASRQAIDEFRKISFKEVTQGSTGSPSPSDSPVDIASQLERLAKLLDSGYLTPEEFQAQKKRLLNT